MIIRAALTIYILYMYVFMLVPSISMCIHHTDEPNDVLSGVQCLREDVVPKGIMLSSSQGLESCPQGNL